MGKNVILTEAMIAGTLAAITELQIRIARVGLAADGTFMVIAALMLLLLDGLFEMDMLV